MIYFEKFIKIFRLLYNFFNTTFILVGVNSTITNLLIFLFNISLFFIFGFKNGKIATNKGYFAGLKVGGLFLLLLIIINLFTNKNIFRISTLIYYLVLVLASVSGGMLGINKKEEK